MANLNLATCFQYTNPSNGDLVVIASIEDYVKLIGNKVCSQQNSLTVFQNALASFSVRLTKLENTEAEDYTLPSLAPTGIANPNVSLPLDEFVAELEEQFVQQRSAVGSTTGIFEAITILSGMNSSKALGTTGGTLGNLSGWKPTINDLSQFVTNLAVMAQDLRSAVQNIKLSCCTNSCNSVEIALQATYASRILTLFFTGSVPDNLINDGPGWRVKVEDQSGNYVYHVIDVKGNMNISSGVTIDLTSTSLNFVDDLKVSGVYSLKDEDLGTVCQKYLEKVISNQTSCPTVTVTSNFTSLGYKFTHVEGNLTYSIHLYDLSNVMLQSQQVSVSGPFIVQGTFSGLTAGTQYKVRVEMITTESSRLCPFTLSATLPNVCPAPNGVSATLEY